MAARKLPAVIDSGTMRSLTATSVGINRTASASDAIGLAIQVKPAAAQRSCAVVAVAARNIEATDATRALTSRLGISSCTVYWVDYSTALESLGALELVSCVSPALFVAPGACPLEKAGGGGGRNPGVPADNRSI